MHEEENKKPSPAADDAQQQEQWNTPLTDEPIALAAETIPESEQPSTSNLQPLNPDMEVHHHTHASHGKKNWKSYFWEFIMLFLAVFCGFLAEYQLEHTIEHNREKQFMVSLLRDLELDSIQFNNVQQSHAERLSRTDSVLVFFAQNENEKIPAIIYRDAFDLIRGNSFYQNSGTMDQLKNSGGMRLISKRIVVDSIQGYDLLVKRLVVRDAFQVTETIKNIDLLQKLFEGQSLSKLFVDTMIYKRSVDLKNTFIPINKPFLSDYLNHLRESRFIIYENMRLRDRTAQRASNLISLIKKEYNLR